MFEVGRAPTTVDPNGYNVLAWMREATQILRSGYVTKTVTTTYKVEDGVFYVRADASGGAFTVTIPAAVSYLGRQIVVKKIDASANAVTVSRTGSDTIEGSNTVSLASQWDKTRLIAGASGSWEKL